MMSFGHAAYFGLGAYGAGLTLKFLAASTPLAILLGTLLGGLAGTLFGLLIVRRRGVYFAMVTVAFGQVAFYIAYSWNDLTGGYDGLRGFVRAPIHLGPAVIDITSNPNAFYYFLLFVFAIAVGLMAFILRSPFGRTLVAIRENERRARFLGIPIERHIWLSFSISCFFTALAGSLVCAAQQFRRSDGAALLALWRNRHHDGDGRYARLLGSAARRRSVCGAAGLHLVDDRQLDELHRPDLRAGGAVLPARPAGHAAAAGRDMSLLEVRSVSKHFGDLVAVEGVSLNVENGELRAIIGPNGAGKTTFFNMISGFFPPTKGDIVFDGETVTRLPVTARVARGMARTFQITEIFPELSVRENVRIAQELADGFRLHMWVSRAETARVMREVDELLAQVGLSQSADRLVGELSHGDQRAAEIAMALALRPRLLLLDEPTAGMGEQETYQVAGLIRRLHRNSAYTIVLIEHDMRVVFNLADRITVLAEGRMLADGTPQQIAEDPHVQAAYLGKAE